ncbi:MAG: hypothetical protein JWQ80_3470 [Massilia sp.]|nr:hypothetical protein [Massilia sp.]
MRRHRALVHQTPGEKKTGRTLSFLGYGGARAARYYLAVVVPAVVVCAAWAVVSAL